MADEVMTANNIMQRFGSHIVLKNVSFAIKPYTITTIYGPSGCGKSTLLNIIGLLEKPTSGELTLLGHPAPKPNSRAARLLRRTQVSYLFQNFALINDQSIDKNLNLANLNPKETTIAFNNRKSKLLQDFNLDHVGKTEVGTLSCGEQQRLSLVRCLLKPCSIILCDEPTGSLDPCNRDRLFENLEFAKKAGKSIVIVSHDPYIIEHSDVTINLPELMNKKTAS